GAKRWSLTQPSLGLPPVDAIAPCSASTPALLTFTSGSTGQPKAALRTHGFLRAQHRSLSHSLDLQPGEVNLATLPIFVLANLASGVTTLIPNVDLRFPVQINAAKLMAQIQAHSPHSTAASPALLAQLADYCESQNWHLPSFQKIFSGGAPVFPALLERLQKLAPQAQVSAVYGSTEAEPIAHIAYNTLQPADVANMSQGAGLLVGQPVPDIQLRILPDRWGEAITPLTDAAFIQLSLPAGVPGEIVVNGDHVLPGYLHDRGNAETKFRVGEQIWHRTGDAGYLDQQRRLWLLGRCSARTQDQQGTLYPFAVEVAASFVAGIRRTALVEQAGCRILVVELAQSNHQLNPTLEVLKQSLVWAKIQHYRVLTTIPVDKRHNAKVDYPALYKTLEINP
ncbi:MAG TPA: AMP-binding protein, partial [Coleofasciculaceae cyanobacterium]